MLWLTQICSRVLASSSLLHFGFQLLKSHFQYLKLCIFFYLSFSSRHNRAKRKYTSSPGTTNKRENHSKCCSIHSLCLKNSVFKTPGAGCGKHTRRHCYRPPVCCWLCSTYDDGHFLVVILSPAKCRLPPSTPLNSWRLLLPLPNETDTSPNEYYTEAQLPARSLRT